VIAIPRQRGGFAAVDDQVVKTGDVLVYVDVDDIDAAFTKIEKLGGKKLMPKTEIPGFGWFAFFADPTGNRVGLYTTMKPG
jgi:predicted enzyme related to lactoylglutathione lyase